MTPLSPCLTHPPRRPKTMQEVQKALPNPKWGQPLWHQPQHTPFLRTQPLCLLWGRGLCFALLCALQRGGVGGVVLCARVAKLTSRQVMPRTKKELVFKSRLQKSRHVHTFFFFAKSRHVASRACQLCVQQHTSSSTPHSHTHAQHSSGGARALFSATALWSLSPFCCVTHAFWRPSPVFHWVWGSVVFIPPLHF